MAARHLLILSANHCDELLGPGLSASVEQRLRLNSNNVAYSSMALYKPTSMLLLIWHRETSAEFFLVVLSSNDRLFAQLSQGLSAFDTQVDV